MKTDSKDSSAVGDIRNRDFQFSPSLLEFINASGKPVGNLVGELCYSIFGEHILPTCHIENDEENKNKFYFYHTIQIGDVNVSGICLTKKKDSKADCMNRALQVLFDKYMTNSLTNIALQFKDKTTFFEIIKLAVVTKFQNLVKNNSQLMKTDKVLAGILMMDITIKSMTVISLATGNKGIRGCYLSTVGQSVHDCHAEIIARRGLLRFLYGQVISFLKCPEKSIFVRGIAGKLVLRKGITFHLYISTAPCGDARVYDCENNTNEIEVDKNSSKMRFKIENGMGTVLGNENPFYNPPTMDGFISGERLKTMSCTDKILRWNYLGIQGNLLSHFVIPIYLASVTVGDAAGISRIQRGIDTRLTGIPSSSLYSHNSPIVGAGQKLEIQAQAKNNNISANWNIADFSVEMLDTTRGVIFNSSNHSRLCKLDLLSLYHKVSSLLGRPIPSDFTYRDIKLSDTQYCLASAKFYEWIKEKNFGFWQRKPDECETFTCAALSLRPC